MYNSVLILSCMIAGSLAKPEPPLSSSSNGYTNTNYLPPSSSAPQQFDNDALLGGQNYQADADNSAGYNSYNSLDNSAFGNNYQNDNSASGTGYNYPQPAPVEKKIYVHVPPDPAPTYGPPPLQLPPRKHYKIIFVKAPNPPKQPIATPPQVEEKTLVYVLVKKPESPSLEQLKAAAQESIKPSKPEVYFINYKTQKESGPSSSGLIGSGNGNGGGSFNNRGFGAGGGAGGGGNGLGGGGANGLGGGGGSSVGSGFSGSSSGLHSAALGDFGNGNGAGGFGAAGSSSNSLGAGSGAFGAGSGTPSTAVQPPPPSGLYGTPSRVYRHK